MQKTALAALACLALSPMAVRAQEPERDYCPDRPGIGTPACTLSPGSTAVELGLASWAVDRDAGQRQDSFQFGDILVRRGIADHAELQVNWTALGTTRTRDRASGRVEHSTGTGDVTFALRRNLARPDGSGLSLAVMPFVTAPVGRDPAGAGDWAAGLMVPLSYEVSDKVSLATTTEIDAAVDEDGHGRHFAVSEVVGATLVLSETLSATAEYQVLLDRDPQGHRAEHLSGLSLGWLPAHDLQLDLGANLGLDRDAGDAEIYFGVSRRF